MRASPRPFEPELILEVLARHGVKCIVIGGTAATLHGSPFPTSDVDITPAPKVDNYERLSDALYELGAKVRAERTEPLPFSHDGTSLMAAQIWNLSTKYGDLDITSMPSGTAGYDDLSRDALPVRLAAGSVMIASLADIVRSKEAAGRDKDRRVLPLLRELLGEQTKARAQERRRPKQ